MSELTTYQPPTAEVVPHAAHALIEWAQSADAAYALANKLCGTSFVPAQFKGKPVEAAAAMLAGAEVGLSPMASLRAFDVIQGVAAPRALTMRAVAQSQGHEFITDEATPQRVKMRGRRRGSSEWQPVEWTIQRATQLGLTGKDQWKKQPQTMLIARATTELVRLVAADAILGIGYSLEELQDEQAPTHTVTRGAVTATARRAPRPPAPEPVEPEFTEPEPVDVTDAPEVPEPATRPQITKIQAHFTDQGVKDRDEKLRILSESTGRAITSANDLTKAEAHAFIDTFEQATPEPEDEPFWGNPDADPTQPGASR